MTGVIYFLFGLMALSCLGMAWCVVELRRNRQVLEYRTGLLDKIQAVADLTKDDVTWRLKEFNSISYSEMVTKFWKPLGNFYKYKSFLEK